MILIPEFRFLEFVARKKNDSGFVCPSVKSRRHWLPVGRRNWLPFKPALTCTYTKEASAFGLCYIYGPMLYVVRLSPSIAENRNVMGRFSSCVLSFLLSVYASEQVELMDSIATVAFIAWV